MAGAIKPSLTDGSATALITANHKFFGISAVEAVNAGVLSAGL